jgi:acyl-CoA dehydrogenase
MASDQDLVVETVPRHPRRRTSRSRSPRTPRGTPGCGPTWPRPGLTGVGLPEEAGGSGGELADAVAVVRTLAAGAGAVPVAEQLLAAGPALLAAGLDLPDPAEPLTLAVAGAVTAEPVDDGDGPGALALTGTATDVAWAGVARHVAVLAAAPEGIEGAVLALVDAEGAGDQRRAQPGRGAARLAGAGRCAGGRSAADPGAGRGGAGPVRAGAGGAAGRGAGAGAGLDRAVRRGAAPVRSAAGQVPGRPDGARGDGRRGHRR